MRFKVLAGHAIDDNNRCVRQGEVIESNVNLAARHNSPGSIKFQPLDEDVKRLRFADIGTYTAAELARFAVEQGIDVGDAESAEDLLDAVKGAVAA